MIPIPFSDRERQVILTALELLRTTKQEQIEIQDARPVNQYDLLDRQHCLMHTLTAMSKLTKQPVESFRNPQPSQLEPGPEKATPA
jgi:hypothetical protein